MGIYSVDYPARIIINSNSYNEAEDPAVERLQKSLSKIRVAELYDRLHAMRRRIDRIATFEECWQVNGEVSDFLQGILNNLQSQPNIVYRALKNRAKTPISVSDEQFLAEALTRDEKIGPIIAGLQEREWQWLLPKVRQIIAIRAK